MAHPGQDGRVGLLRSPVRTLVAIRLALSRRDTLAIAGTSALAYLAVFLWAVQDLTIDRLASPELLVAADPLGAAMRRTGPASFDRVARIDTGLVTWFVSPGNLAIGLVIASLVGVSLALSYLAIVQPKACRLGAGTGLLAGLPALLGGSVCCAPVIAIVLGIQLTAGMMTLFAWLLPLAMLLLLGSILYLGSRIRPETLA